MSLDFSTAERQRVGDLIPDGEIVPVHMTIRPGGAGDGNWLKRNKNGDCLMLDCEFTVIEGPFAKRKFWSLLTTEGETEGQKKAAEISRSRLRAALESARGIDPSDESPAAMEARRVTSYADFDGLRFVAVVGLEKGDGQYKDKNVLKAVLTPDRKGWGKLEQLPRTARAATPAATTPATQPARVSTGKPAWAA